MSATQAAQLVELRRSRVEWTAMLESVRRCQRELLSYAMAYREPDAWRELENVDALIEMLTNALKPRSELISIALPCDTWLRHVSAFRTGVEDVERSYRYGQGNPAWLAEFPDKAAYPMILADWHAFLAALPEDCRDGARVCDNCQRLLPLALFATAVGGSGYLNRCRACLALLPQPPLEP